MGPEIALAFAVLLLAVLLPYGAARLGLTSPQGYLIVGALAGPFGLALIQDPEIILTIGEAGVIFLLFLFGLEFGLVQMRLARQQIVTYGATTFAGWSVPLLAAFWLLLNDLTLAAVAALLFSFSSIALGVQAVAEKHLGATQSGRALSAVLGFQILIFAPVSMTVLALIGGAGTLGVPVIDAFAENLPYLLRLFLGVGALLAISTIAYPLMRHVVRNSLSRGYGDIATAACVLIVLSVMVAGDNFGVPAPALAYLAGLAFSRSDIRHAMGERLLPIKGILLLVLFTAIGMSLDLAYLVENALFVAVISGSVITVKFLVGWLFGLLTFRQTEDRLTFAIGAMSPGELTYAMLGTAFALNADRDILQLLLAAVLVVMLATPLFLVGSKRRSERIRVFISYSRRESESAAAVASLLARNDIEVLMDTRDLPFGEAWRDELDRFIRQSDAIVWLVSPASVESTWCKWEIGRVAVYGKRVVPVMAKQTDPALLPPSIGDVQILPRIGVFKASDRTNRRDLIETLRRDNAWLKLQTRLLERARDWDIAGRGGERLLRGGELSDAKSWVTQRPQAQSAVPALLLDFIETSEAASG